LDKNHEVWEGDVVSYLRGISAYIVGFGLVLYGCGEAANEIAVAGDDVAARAESLMPEDASLASLYEDTCFSCHSVADSGAPLTGDTDAWDARLEQGMDVLLDHTIDGFGGMPPLGSCMDCSGEDFEALIEFMSTGE
jgi:cytochrome c5